MNDTQYDDSPDADAPFGTRPRRPIGPIVVFGGLYLLCLGALLWMARAQSVG